MSKTKLRNNIIFAVVCAVVVAGWIIAEMADRIFGGGSRFTIWVNTHVLNNFGDGNRFIRTGVLLLVGYVIITALMTFTRLFGLKGSKRYQTIISLIASITKYIGGIIVLVLLMGIWNVDPTIIAAIIAALGIAIGFGAQGLIGDMLAGLFLIFENALKVGDFVTFDNFRGEVVEVGIRATRLRSRAGDVKVINNSELRVFINMSMHESTAVCDIAIEYTEDLQKVEKLVNDNLSKIRQKFPAITDGPWYLGVSAFTERGVVLRIVAKCDEDMKPQTTRDMNREFKMLFDKHKIKIAIPKIEVKNGK